MLIKKEINTKNDTIIGAFMKKMLFLSLFASYSAFASESSNDSNLILWIVAGFVLFVVIVLNIFPKNQETVLKKAKKAEFDWMQKHTFVKKEKQNKDVKKLELKQKIRELLKEKYPNVPTWKAYLRELRSNKKSIKDSTDNSSNGFANNYQSSNYDNSVHNDNSLLNTIMLFHLLDSSSLNADNSIQCDDNSSSSNDSCDSSDSSSDSGSSCSSSSNDDSSGSSCSSSDSGSSCSSSSCSSSSCGGGGD